MKYYAVKVGRQPGIYLDWDSCKEQVNGFKGAKHKSFKTIKEANEYLFSNEYLESIETVDSIETSNFVNNAENKNKNKNKNKKESEISWKDFIDFMESKSTLKK